MDTLLTTPQTDQPKADSIRHGILVGVAPLLVAAIWIGVTFGGILLARQLTSNQEYIVQERAAIIVAVVGLVLTAAAFALASVRTLMLVHSWLRAGLSQPAVAALWTLSVTALALLLPLILAALLPQHPAPPRPPDLAG